MFYKRLRFIYSDKEKTKILLSRVDISDIVREQQLREKEEKKRLIYLENMSVACLELKILTDDAGIPYDFKIVYSNKAFTELAGEKYQNLIGERFYEVFKDADAKWLEYYSEIAYEGTSRVINRYSSELKKHLLVDAFQTEPGQCGCVLMDVSEEYYKKQELENSREELRKKAQMDSLTGVLNAGTGKLLVENRISQQEEFDYNAIFLMDIDDFKTINDTKGHMVGDEVLKAFAGVLKKIFHSEDIIYRLGGDEFVVFVENIHKPAESVEKIMNRFAGEIERVRERYPLLTSSVGIYIANKRHSFKDYYKQVDKALYQTKKEGKNHYTVRED